MVIGREGHSCAWAPVVMTKDNKQPTVVLNISLILKAFARVPQMTALWQKIQRRDPTQEPDDVTAALLPELWQSAASAQRGSGFPAWIAGAYLTVRSRVLADRSGR